MSKEWLDKENLLSQLDDLPIDANRYKSIVDFCLDQCIVDIMDMLDSEFDSELGPPAYPRMQLLLNLVFAEQRGVEDINLINELGYTDDVFKIINPTKVPTRNTLMKVINCKDDIIFLSVFLYTLVKMNEYDFLDDITDNYLDGSDGRVNASVNYLISEDEIEALELMNKWGLIHDGSDSKMKRVKATVNCKLRYYKNNPDFSKLIGLILKRIKLYNKTVYSKIDKFKEALVDVDKKYVSVNFPEAFKIPTKQGGFDVGLNVQEVVTSNSIILSCLLSRKANDLSVLSEVGEELKRNVAILKKLQENYGEKENYGQLDDLFLKSNIWCDSGYDGEDNIKYIMTSKINFIILPKKLAKQINDALRKRNTTSSKKKNQKKNKTLKNDDDYSIKECIRIIDGYLCPMGRPINLIDTILENSEYNKQKDLPEPLLRYHYIHKCEDCKGCPYYMKHEEPCSVANYKETTTQYKYELVNTFLSGKYDEGYTRRFPVSEGVNGYLKRKKGILCLYGNTLQAAKNHLLLKNTLYNIIRFVKLKDSVW